MFSERSIPVKALTLHHVYESALELLSGELTKSAFGTGDFHLSTYAPLDAKDTDLNEFSRGGIIEELDHKNIKNGIQKISDDTSRKWLVEKILSLCGPINNPVLISTLYDSRPNDRSLRKEPINKIYHGDEVYLLLTKTEITETTVHNVIKKSRSFVLQLGLICDSDTHLPTNSSIETPSIGATLNGLKGFYLGAYDGEGYLFGTVAST